MLTNKEVQVLNAILDEALLRSKEEDDGDPVFHSVEVNCVNTLADTGVQSDVFASLAKNGLIECDGTEDSSGNEVIEYVCITPKGLGALKAAKGVH
jgi:hypothetical protein